MRPWKSILVAAMITMFPMSVASAGTAAQKSDAAQKPSAVQKADAAQKVGAAQKGKIAERRRGRLRIFRRLRDRRAEASC